MLLKRGVILKTMNQELVLKYTDKATENMLIDGQLASLRMSVRRALLAHKLVVISYLEMSGKESFKNADKIGCGVLVSKASREDDGIMLGTPFPTDYD